MIREETYYWKQRSRVLWLKVGDRKTAFFIDLAQFINEETLFITSETKIM